MHFVWAHGLQSGKEPLSCYIYIYIYIYIRVCSISISICDLLPSNERGNEKGTELQDNDTEITLHSLPGATYLLSHSFKSLMKH